VSIVTTLLRANEKENLTTRISNKQTKPILKGLVIFIHVGMATARKSA